MRYLKKKIRKLKKWIDKNQRKSLYIALALSVVSLFLCYVIGTFKKDYNNENYRLNFKESDVTEIDFPYHYLTKYDFDISEEDSVLVNLNEYEEEVLYILNGGTYEITGELNGRIHINAKDEVVHLILNNVEIESNDGPALLVENAVRTIITLKEDSVNKISDSGRYKELSEYESAITCLSNVTFNGTGSLEVYGLYKDGIRSRDVVKVVDGYISIHAKRSGIHGTDGIYVDGGTIYIASEKSGFKTTKNGLNNRGALMIMGGDITIIAGRYSFSSEAPVFIYNCHVFENSVARYSGNSQKYEQTECFE